MASNPLYPAVPSQPERLSEEPRLSYDEGWELIMSLMGSSKGMYDEFGGVDAYLRMSRSDEPLP